MPKPPPKDWLDLMVDFFCGAIAGDFIFGFATKFPWRTSTPLWQLQCTGEAWVAYFLSATLMGGALCALYRHQLWSDGNSFSIPISEMLTARSKTLMRFIGLIGVAFFLRFLFLYHFQR
jgi:hypothetical protein